MMRGCTPLCSVAGREASRRRASVCAELDEQSGAATQEVKADANPWPKSLNRALVSRRLAAMFRGLVGHYNKCDGIQKSSLDDEMLVAKGTRESTIGSVNRPQRDTARALGRKPIWPEPSRDCGAIQRDSSADRGTRQTTRFSKLATESSR